MLFIVVAFCFRLLQIRTTLVGCVNTSYGGGGVLSSLSSLLYISVNSNIQSADYG